MADENLVPVVLDAGSGCVKVGYAGKTTPTGTFASVVAAGCSGDGESGGGGKDVDMAAIVGDKALDVGDGAVWPIQRGRTHRWDDVETLWKHAFTSVLGSDPREHPVLLAEPAMNPLLGREAMTQLMFEGLEVPALYIVSTPVLSLYTSGKETGLVVDVGHGLTDVSPVYESVVLSHASQRLLVGGGDINTRLRKLLGSSGAVPEGKVLSDGDVKRIKESVCYAAQDYDAESPAAAADAASITKSVTLPDGTVISVGAARFEAPEAVFSPTLIGQDDVFGAGECVAHAIQHCDLSLRNDLVSNVVIAGGTTMIPGFTERLTTEAQARMAPKIGEKVRVRAEKTRVHGAWSGGSILASLPLFEGICVTSQEYEDQGPSIVHRKCA